MGTYRLRAPAIATVGGAIGGAGGGWWVGNLLLQQSDAEELALLVDALDHVSVELEFADDDGGKVDPAGAQLIERHWLRARLP